MIPLVGRVVAQRLVRARRVVLRDAVGNQPPELGRGLVLVYPQVLALKASEPPLHDHVVHPAGLPVHALARMMLGEQPLVLGGAEYRPLVAVRDGGLAVLIERAAHALAHARRPHVRRQPPADDVTQVPVDHAGRVHMGPPYGDVGDVDAPYLVGKRHRLALEQVRALDDALGGLKRLGL